MSELQKALVEIMKEVGYVQKDAANTHHKYRYASADAVMTKVRESCAKHGVCIGNTQVDLIHYDGANRIVKITQVYRKGDEHATFSGIGEGKDNQDKGTMKANTAALKYLLANAFNISWGDDPEATTEDGDSTSKPAKRHRTKKTTKTATPNPSTVEANIASANDLATLEGVKETIRAFREGGDADTFNNLVATYRAREAQLKEMSA